MISQGRQQNTYGTVSGLAISGVCAVRSIEGIEERVEESEGIWITTTSIVSIIGLEQSHFLRVDDRNLKWERQSISSHEKSFTGLPTASSKSKSLSPPA